MTFTTNELERIYGWSVIELFFLSNKNEKNVKIKEKIKYFMSLLEIENKI